ncbi:MAG TPA: hypothetical protein VMT54_13260 [Candidatus Cybelea sp.]|nr:hypothetical protein [Candidatus Cybelea sp.]
MLIDYPELQWHLRHADLGALTEEIHARILRRMGHRPFVLAGVSLGAIVGALAVRLHRGDLHVVRIVGLDPVGSLDPDGSLENQLGPGWLARNLTRARRAGPAGLPGFLWIRFNRSIARVLAPRLRRKGGLASLAARLLPRVGTGLFCQQLRMRLLVDTTARWRRDGAWRRDRVAAPRDVPCMILLTSDTAFDADFWAMHFNQVDVLGIEGDHDTWHELDGPRMLLEQWDAAFTPADRDQAAAAL